MPKMIGFLFGFLFAGIAVLLNAPMSGKACRKKLIEQKNRWKQSGSRLKEDVKEAKNSVIQLAKTSKNVAAEFQSSFNDWKEDIAPNLERLQNEFDRLKEKAEKAAKENRKD